MSVRSLGLLAAALLSGCFAPATPPLPVPSSNSDAPPVAIAEGVQVGPAGLAIPVAGIKASQLTDTFTQARAGGARVHDAIDIMADEGTPVIAATEGTVEKLGLASVTLKSDDGRIHHIPNRLLLEGVVSKTSPDDGHDQQA